MASHSQQMLIGHTWAAICRCIAKRVVAWLEAITCTQARLALWPTDWFGWLHTLLKGSRPSTLHAKWSAHSMHIHLNLEKAVSNATIQRRIQLAVCSASKLSIDGFAWQVLRATAMMILNQAAWDLWIASGIPVMWLHSRAKSWRLCALRGTCFCEWLYSLKKVACSAAKPMLHTAGFSLCH